MTEPAQQTTETKPVETTTQPETSEAKPAETKPAETALVNQKPPEQAKPAEVVVPLVEGDLAFPEGLTKDDALSKEFIDLMNKPLSPKERANELLKLQSKALTTASEKGSQEFADLQKQWRNEVMSDPELGGAKWPVHSANIAKMLDRFGTTEARMAFEVTGAGDNPHIVRMLAKIAAAVNEPGAVQGAPASIPQSLEDRLYPNQGKAT